MENSLSRRQLLSLGGGVIATVVVGGLGWPRPAAALQSGADGGRSAKTLVVVDLQGGNDALNTLVPQVGRYRDLRPGLALDDAEMLTFAGLQFGVHPALAPLQPLWDAGQMTALYGTGLDGQGRSHFVAQDAWRSATPGAPARSGWLGRWLEASASPAQSSLRGIALGQSSLAAQGESGRPVAIQSVDGFRLDPPNGNDAVVDAVLAMGSPAGSGLFGQAQAAIPATVDAVSELQRLVGGIATSSDPDVIDLDGDRALFAAARAIIQGDVGAEIVYVTIDGFDTHALQAQKQAALLALVAEEVSALYESLAETGHDESTTVLVVSEFGRRASENGAQGTDHGQGGLSFLIGPPVLESTVIGEPDLDDLQDDGLRIEIDARVMYDSSLRWLGASDEQVVTVLGAEYDDYPLLQA